MGNKEALDKLAALMSFFSQFCDVLDGKATSIKVVGIPESEV